MKIQYHSEAVEELKEAINYYKKIDKNIVIRFLKKFNLALEKVKMFPKAWPVVSNNDIRRCLLNKFPFGIIYFTENDIIYILAIMHLSKKPNYWKERF